MSITSAELRKLASLNLSPEQMSGVLELLALRAEREEQRALADQERKAADAARKREERAAKKSKNVQGQSMDNQQDVQSTPSPLVPPLSPAPLTPPIIPPSTRHLARANPKTDLPNDWEPDAKTWALADELGFTPQQAWDQLERMRDWAKNADGGKGRKSDWNAAFRNWLKRASDDKRNRPSAQRQRNPLHATLDAIDACADEAIRRSGGHGAESSEENPDLIPGLWKGAA